jgi:hypothetical protein
MAARALDSRSAGENSYGSLRADFDAAYKRMTDSSREFNAVLMTVPAGLSPEENRARKDGAAQAYEVAHERFLAAVAKLNEFMIGQIISSRAGIQVAPTVIDRESAGPQALKQTDSRLRSGHRSLAREYPAISGRPTFAPGDDTSGLA